jgi:hypothetical protein
MASRRAKPAFSTPTGPRLRAFSAAAGSLLHMPINPTDKPFLRRIRTSRPSYPRRP